MNNISAATTYSRRTKSKTNTNGRGTNIKNYPMPPQINYRGNTVISLVNDRERDATRAVAYDWCSNPSQGSTTLPLFQSQENTGGCRQNVGPALADSGKYQLTEFTPSWATQPNPTYIQLYLYLWVSFIIISLVLYWLLTYSVMCPTVRILCMFPSKAMTVNCNNKAW